MARAIAPDPAVLKQERVGWSPIGLVRRSLMVRVLLPVAVVFAATLAGLVFAVAVRESAAARASLSAKVRLTGEIAKQGAAEAVWNLDAPLAKATLSAFAADLDYVGSELADDHGGVLASDG